MGIIKLKKANEEATVAENFEKSLVTEEVIPAENIVAEESASRWEDPAVLNEDEEHTDENSRHYILNNNTGKSIYSGASVNYYDETTKKWERIDNSLTEKEDCFEGKLGKFKASVSKEGKGKKVEINGNGLSLSWEYLGKTSKTEVYTNTSEIPLTNLGEVRQPQSMLKVEKCRKGILQSVGSEAMYENVEANTDLEYKIEGNNIKENIIVRERAEEYKYLFSLNTQGLKLRLSEDNTNLEFYSEKVQENGECEEQKEFTIPSPYMYDANGETSEEVYYELEPQTEGKYVFSVVASTEWMNAEERAFPVVIDPQIITNNSSLISFQNYSRTLTNGTPSGSWTKVSGSYINVELISIREYKSEIYIEKSKISGIDNNKISQVNLILSERNNSNNGKSIYVNGSLCTITDGKVTANITTAYKGTTGKITITVTGSNGNDLYFSASGSNAPVLEIEYLTDEGTRPTKKAFSLAGTATAEVNLATGDTIVSFGDVAAENSVIGLGISHVYKKSSEENFVGENFRLNLHETFVKNGNTALDTTYIYTDAKGDKHGFKDYYYYINGDGRKVYITSKTSITVDPDGTLKYVGSKVYPEYRSSTGLKAVTQLENFINYESIEQRTKEYKQLEEQVKSYKNAYLDFVLLYTSSGNFYSVSYDDIFYDYTSSSTMVVPESVAIQYGALKKQYDNLNKNYTDGQIVLGDTSVNEAVLALESQIFESTKLLKKYVELCTSSEPEGKIKMRECLNNGDPVPEWAYNLLTDDYLKYQEFNKSGSPMMSGAALKVEFRRRNLLLEQLSTQTQQVNEQRTLVKKQMDSLMKEHKRREYSQQLQNYYKEYINKNAELEQMKRQTPINFLTDGQIIKGYNNDGQLVAVYDNYGNYAVVEYEKSGVATNSPTRIARIYDKDGKEVRFSYNPQNRLSEITDTRGRKTKYEYSEKKLLKVKYDTGKEIAFGYLNNNITLVKEEKNALRTNLSYNANKLSSVNNYSTIDGIPKTNTSEVSSLISSTTITYSQIANTIMNYVTITEDSHADKYIFDSNRNCSAHYVSENGVVTKAEQYEYVPYWKGTAAQSNPRSVTKYAKKDTLYKTALTSFVFTVGDTETTTLDQFNNPLKTTTSAVKLTANGSNQQTTVVDYTYDDDQKLKEEKTTVSYTNPSKTIIGYKKYIYNASGSVVRTESYVEGEENTTGKTIEETVYDENGNIVKSFAYNSLDSSSKFYKESEYSENGQLLSDLDETGECKTEYEYISGTNIVRTQKLPNGSKFAYGHDESDAVTSITQSTEEGEENSNSTSHTYGEVTEMRSGNNVVEYEYDYKRRLTSVKLNETANYVKYNYTEKTTDTVNGVSKTVDKVTVTYAPREGSSSETFVTSKDLRGNLLKTSYNGNVQTEYTYTADDKLESVIDRVSGRKTTYTYDALDRVTKNTETKVSDGVQVYQEVYTYNNDGTLASKAISEAVTQTYTYTYKNNSAQTLDYFTVGTLKVSPKTDCLGRNMGKEIALSGTKVYEEIIAYRKVGDHATQMPSTIRYGDKVGGAYGIRDSLKYVYDEMGNIAKVYENGELSVRYTYDKLSRLIREDNKFLGETYLFDYDNNGNILTKRTLAFTLKGKEEVEELSSTAREYTYEGDRLLSYNGETFTYDGLGNPKTYRGKPLTWSKGRQLTNYNGTTFGYDGQGQRTSKGNIIYTYGSDGQLLKQSDGWEFLYDNGGVMGFIYGNTTDDNRYLYRKDILGNITGILDKNGKIIVKYKYDAWGNHAAVCLNLKDGREEFCDITDETISFTGKYATYKTLAEKNPFRYRSYYYDTETDMYYLKTRYYDPEIGRFITIDDVSYLAPDTINGLNLYAYCGNNPIMRVDANGTAWWHWLVSIGVVVALAVATVAVTVATGGTALGGLAAIYLAANGVASATFATTLFAFATVGAATILVASGVAAGINMIDDIISGDGIDEAFEGFLDYGENTLSATIMGGILGGISGYFSHVDFGTKTPAKLRPFGTYHNVKNNTYTHYGINGRMWWSYHLTNHGNSKMHPYVPHYHAELPHYPPKGFETFKELIKELIARFLGGGHS